MKEILSRLRSNLEEAPFLFYLGLMVIIIVGTALAVVFDPPPKPVVNELSIDMPIAPVLDKQELVDDTLDEAINNTFERSYSDDSLELDGVVVAPSNEYDEVTGAALLPEISRIEEEDSK